MFGCIEGLRAKALCSAVLRGSLFGVCVCVIVTSCVCQLD